MMTMKTSDPAADDAPTTLSDDVRVDEAIAESFPASDPPSFAGGVSHTPTDAGADRRGRGRGVGKSAPLPFVFGTDPAAESVSARVLEDKEHGDEVR